MKSLLPRDLDPYQFACRYNRCVADAVNYCLHAALSHLEPTRSKKGISPSSKSVRILFIDYYSAFNTIIPSKLYMKLIDLKLPFSLCNWILDFLLERKHIVKIGSNFSQPLVLSIGTPQGCGLSPMLYSLFTYDCRVSDPSCVMVKFADDTTLSGLILNGDDSIYRTQISSLVSWCETNNLILNVDKTKEMIIDFSKNQSNRAISLLSSMEKL